MLRRNGFNIARKGNHEIWVLPATSDLVSRRVPVSYGNAEIKTKRLFADMLAQAGKSEEHFYRVLRNK